MIKKLLNRIHGVLGKSVFTSLFFVYSASILISVAILGVVFSHNTSGILLTQESGYINRQLSSLESAFEGQIDYLKSLERRIYTLNIDQNDLVYDYIKSLLSANNTTNQTYINQQRSLNNYLSFVENPSEKDITLFLLSGKQPGPGDYYNVQSEKGIGANFYITRLMSVIHGINQPDINQQSAYILPAVKISGNKAVDNVYTIYDYIRDYNDPSQYIGYIVMAYTTSTLDSSIGNDSEEAYILNNAGQVVYSSSGKNYDETFKYFNSIAHKNEQSIKTDGKLISAKYDKKYGFYTVGVIQEGILYNSIEKNNLFAFFVVLACSIFAIFLTNILTRLVLKRLRPIIAVMKKAQGGDLTARAPVTKQSNEFDYIAGNLNIMIEKINEHINAEYLSEIKRKSAELKQKGAELYALQVQINPHFLYNTLEILRMKAISNNDRETADLIRVLATIFRSRIKESMVITIRDEIEYCSSLMKLYSLRYDGELDYEFEIDPSIHKYGILKDLLPPFIENAIVHGLSLGSGTESEGRITITGKYDNGDVIFTVSDNGRGIDPDSLSNITASLLSVSSEDLKSLVQEKHIGIINVQQRIKLVFGDRYGVEIANSPIGTVATVRIIAVPLDDLIRIAENTNLADRG